MFLKKKMEPRREGAEANGSDGDDKTVQSDNQEAPVFPDEPVDGVFKEKWLKEGLPAIEEAAKWKRVANL